MHVPTARRTSFRRTLRARGARFHETRLYLASHPVMWMMAGIVSRLGPVVRVPRLGYVVNDPAVARAILLADKRFTKSGPGGPADLYAQVMGSGNGLLTTDGADHRQMRARLSDIFSPANVAARESALLSEFTDRLRSDLEKGDTVDLVQFVHLMTGGMITHLLGIVPEAGRADETYLDIHRLCETMISGVQAGTKKITPEQLRESRAAFEQLVDYARQAYNLDLLQAGSVIHRLRDVGLSFEEIKPLMAILLLTGTETVSTSFPRIIAMVLDTGLLSHLRLHPESVPKAVDEGLRLVVPAPMNMRSVEQPADIHGHHFEPGNRVILLTYNMLKHPRYFPDPTSFDLDREVDPEVKHLWYGAGPHFCLGHGLAQLEMETLLRMVVELPSEIRIVKRGYGRGAVIPSYSKLEIRLA